MQASCRAHGGESGKGVGRFELRKLDEAPSSSPHHDHRVPRHPTDRLTITTTTTTTTFPTRRICLIMAPKDKGKGGGKDSGDKGDKGGGKLKPATSINVRHILCEKHSKKEEALGKLRDGVKFDEVAREFSEDKARQGG